MADDPHFRGKWGAGGEPFYVDPQLEGRPTADLVVWMGDSDGNGLKFDSPLPSEEARAAFDRHLAEKAAIVVDRAR